MEVKVNELTEYKYMLLMYDKYNINIDDEYCDYDNNIHNLYYRDLSYNNMACKVPHPCQNCKYDLNTFNGLVKNKNTEELINFDTNKSKLRKCSNVSCLWYKYFMSRRLKTNSINYTSITIIDKSKEEQDYEEGTVIKTYVNKKFKKK